MYKKIKQITAVFVLLAFVGIGTALAQGGSIAPSLFYSGVETSPGIFNGAASAVYGNTFVLNSKGEWETHHLTVSLNYDMSLAEFKNCAAVTGGTWSLVKYDNQGQYVGTLYGDVKSGFIEFTDSESKKRPGKRIYAELESRGGLGSFQPRKVVTGILEIKTDPSSLQTNGVLELLF